MYIPELLSPVGDFECLKAAVQNGANAVYLGASSFSARAKATNFDNKELKEAIIYAKSRNVKVHLALNTLIKNDEFDEAVKLAVDSYNMGIDAIIIQDLGLATYLIENYPDIPLHASTQMTVHNLDGVLMLQKLGFKRVVLSRELSLDEIKYIKENSNIELEVFIHGALCISYSGQCLLSSLIGGRSGNRGMCAQPCRLKYDLIENDNYNENSIDSGYLMSPKDTLGINYLPELINMGIDSFKIEGRMKTPYYVGIVTRIYRKYIDLITSSSNLKIDDQKRLINESINIKNEETGLSDIEELIQSYNRGNFGPGHFKTEVNKELIYKEKPNNMGFFLGTISHINENKGHLTISLNNTLSIGDKISINNESYTVSELMINNQNLKTAQSGKVVKIGRMKGPIKVGMKVYKIESQKLNHFISPTFKEEKEFKKVLIDGNLVIKNNCNIIFNISSSDSFYNNISISYTHNYIPEKAINREITLDDINKQIRKTGNTFFEFNNLNITLDNNLFIPSSILNDIRRNALENYKNEFLKDLNHNLVYFKPEIKKVVKSQNKSNKISLFLNKLNMEYDYSNINHIDAVYIPLRYFIDNNYKNVIKSINHDLYIYMPIAIKDSILNKIDFDNILNNFKIKGFIISNISEISILKKYKDKEFIGNYNLNIYNSFTINKLFDLGLNRINISPELNLNETNELETYKEDISNYFETIVYGNLPVMTNNYCYLGKSNKCYDKCDKKCLNKCSYYLKDRMNMKFRILPDNITKTTTIFNSKTLSIKKEILNSKNIRIDIIDENIEKIQEIIDTVISNNRFEGKEFTNGNYN